MNPKVCDVKALKNYELELTFANGEHKFFSLLPYLEYPVFKPLRDIDLFMKAKVTMGFVSWTEDIDLSHDTLYLDSISIDKALA